MNLVAGAIFAAIAFGAGTLLIVFRVQFSAASARVQTRFYGPLGRKTSAKSTPGMTATIGGCFLAFGVIFLLLGLSP